MLVLFFGAAGAAVVLLVLVTQPLGLNDAGQSAQSGAGFYVIGDETSGVQVGQRAPDFAGGENGDVRLTTLDGETVSIEAFRGRPLWVFFWATWCPPCQQETPDIQKAWEAHRDEGLVIFGIDIQEPAEIVEEYVQTYSLTYPIGLDVTAEVMQTYQVFGLPTHYFIDRDGIVRDRWFGPLTLDQMEQKINLISGGEE